MTNRMLVTAMWVGASQLALAQSPPGAGSQLQQIPPAPARPAETPAIAVPGTTAGQAAGRSAPDATRFRLSRLSITGASRYTEAELVAVSAFEPGREASLQDLRDMAARITDRYRQDGYLVARAHLPAQEIRDGVVNIAVVEGQLGEIRINNAADFDTGVAASRLVGLNGGDVIAIEPLESRLLLLSDLPGLRVRSTLLPGVSPGLSDLLIEVTPGARWSGSVDADNAGNRYTGAYRAGGQINLNNPLGRGDVASLRGVTSGAGLQYLRGSYQLPVGKARAGVAYSHLAYALGREFDALDAHGTARVASVFGSYPLRRSRQTNLSLGLSLDAKALHDHVDAFQASTEKRARSATVSLVGDHRDRLGGLGGVSTYGAAWTSGRLDIRSPAALAIDAATAKTNGRYNKLALSASRLQQLTDSLSLMGSASAQWGSKNLDASEEMELGGLYGVRAYPTGEANADQGYLLSAELRRQLRELPTSFPGELQVLAFVDYGSVALNHTPWSAVPNHRRLAAAGVGAVWSRVNDFSIRAYLAHQVGDEAATSAPDKSGRFWIQAVKYF